MRITALEYDIFWKNPQKNFETIQKRCQNISTDLLVLPEMFNTGFCMQAEDIAENQNGPSLAFLLKLSQDLRAAVVASMAFVENGLYYNRLFFIRPDGTYEHYNKRHLFAFAGEDKVFTKGTEACIVEYQNTRIMLQICYDLRFPVFARNRQDYDLLIYVANWPASRQLAWDSLLIARAIENQAYVLGLNRSGIDANSLKYEGNSRLISFDGQILAQVQNGVINYDVKLDPLNDFRKNFPFLKDADNFHLD